LPYEPFRNVFHRATLAKPTERGHHRRVSPRSSATGRGSLVDRKALRDPRLNRGLDDVSTAIIELLQADGRTSYATIAKSVGLSDAAVRVRVQRLLDSDVMQIVAVTDPLQLGFTRQAMVGIRTEGDTRLVADLLTDMSEVTYVVTTAGSFDLIIEVVCEDDEELLDLVSRRIRTLPGVASTETFVYLKLNKQHYNWGTR
jgi:Lrp/AsnC family transcriptional regulator, regulator for asnA, asnC and gidA